MSHLYIGIALILSFFGGILLNRKDFSLSFIVINAGIFIAMAEICEAVS